MSNQQFGVCVFSGFRDAMLSFQTIHVQDSDFTSKSKPLFKMNIQG